MTPVEKGEKKLMAFSSSQTMILNPVIFNSVKATDYSVKLIVGCIGVERYFNS